MKAIEFRKQTKEVLKDTLQDKRKQLENLSFLWHQKKIKNTKERRELRRDIARILTIMRTQ